MSDNKSIIVKVVVPRRVWETYDYNVPRGIAKPPVGARVSVPLGHGRAVGIVVEYVERSDFELKDIERIIDEKPLVSEEVVELGMWLSDYYHHPLGSVFETMLPNAAIRGQPAKIEPEKQWTLVEQANPATIRANAKRQQQAWQTIREHKMVRESDLKSLDITRSALDALERKRIVKKTDVALSQVITPSSIAPTVEQKLAINAIKSDLGKFQTFLLDGVTGSGKTEVYLQVIDEAIRQGKQALVLVPEIALTPQMTNRFHERFSRMAVMHSMISNAKRFETWCQAARGDMPIIVGTRSAVFTPFKHLGVIVVDEEHDASYKQSESLRYSARDVAVMRASKLGIPCVLGSATPSMESVMNARSSRYRYLQLSHRPGAAQLPTFHVQDMRHTQVNGGICEPLLRTIRKHLNRDGQVLILINRRGHSTYYICTDCGWTANCSDCDVRLTLHEVPTRLLQCHSCGRRYQPVTKCPDCGKKSIATLGVGTQQVEETLAETFPDVPRHRIDRDSVRTNRQLTAMFTRLQYAKEGLLIGTQMLAKGHHFPNVTMVAVIAADNGFLSTDFRGPERTAQLIVQVAGRAGRAEKRGEVWIQSYDPDNPDLRSLVRDGYGGFTETELRLRQEANFPPFGQMAVIRAEGPDERVAEEFCAEVLNALRQCDVKVYGPMWAPITRVARQYRFQGMVLASKRSQLHDALKTVERMRPKSRKTRWSIDVDPSEMA
ncbi:MAG: primosomal protein N' [Gammaproteobacteria bacterium]|nr:primosomal protein N' [Gammaproteobacteria bacterium]